ncbi:phosphoribosyltransferase family protein [Polaromonas sp.]|uniref:phosphoribosyltransferase n=1 Tax=Polaromonas sp. TaxID=1869339 RepID=UPI003265C209
MFADRLAAGYALSLRLPAYAGRSDVLVLALSPGGVLVGGEVATALRAGLDFLLVCKLGVPYHPGLTLGAIASGGACYIDPQAVAGSGLTQQQLEQLITAESAELTRRDASYRGSRLPVPIEGRTVIVVDDGLVTGASMCAALMALRASKPAWIVVAVPVAPPGAQERIGTAADEFVCALSPPDFSRIGQYYRNFELPGDEEVRALLAGG